MSGESKQERDGRTLDALLISALRRADQGEDEVDPDRLPQLTDDERAALGALGGDFAKRLLAGERPLPAGAERGPAVARRLAWGRLWLGAAAAACLLLLLSLSLGAWLLLKGDGTKTAGGEPPPGSPVAERAPVPAPEPTPRQPHTGGAARGEDPSPRWSRKALYYFVLKSVCLVQPAAAQGKAAGTGVLIDRENRLVLTNYHVVHGQQDFVVLFPTYDKDGKVIAQRDVYAKAATADDAVKGQVLAHDKTHDCALIQLDRVPDGVDAIPFAREGLAEGDSLHSVNSPGFSTSVFVYSSGVVRKVYNKTFIARYGRDLTLEISSRVIESSSPVSSATGGGPCVIDRGELVGLALGDLAGGEPVMAYFIERGELEKFVNKAFESVPELKGKRWVRSTRAPLTPNNGSAKDRAAPGE
jgi:S1-C subfamily serine protease